MDSTFLLIYQCQKYLSFVSYIKVNEEAYISGYAEYLFNKYKKQNLDIFDIDRLVEMYYPNENIDNPLSVTEILTYLPYYYLVFVM